MKKGILMLIVVLAVAVAAVCLLRRKTPQVPTAIQQDVRGRHVWNFDIISRVLCFSGVKQNV